MAVSDLQSLVATLVEQETALASAYEEIVRLASGKTERELAVEMQRAQAFQLATLQLIAEGRVPDVFHCFGHVTHDQVNVRAGPSAKQPKLKSVRRDERVIVMRFEGNWAQIQLPDGSSGWVFKDYVACLR